MDTYLLVECSDYTKNRFVLACLGGPADNQKNEVCPFIQANKPECFVEISQILDLGSDRFDFW